ncbi:aminoglycoside adenylyltransferase domain-containing protein [Nocardioides sp.]|uniref:aminoglycoside adenylyltransferase domain-containing protein n=1 Tax=Nocardioides sp. TaxID=35761 RepID=UPI00286AD5A3|nr:aminoglycoside adenylyltransferase domain-containing protein [Nocardioides sp.]
MIPAAVEEVCATFLRVAPPDLVTGLYLRGGTGFGEWVPGQSDVDFVATLAHRPDGAAVEALRVAHEQVAAAHPDVAFDGVHVLVADLADPPADCPDVPIVLGRLFEGEGVLHEAVVVWHELAWHGVQVCGPPIAELGVWTSQEVLLAFTRDNLDTYWRGSAEALTAMPSEGAGEEGCCWCVLGVTRLHHLLVTGEMTTKSGAGRWGLSAYPERFHRVLREALRIREDIHRVEGSEYADDRAARGRDTAELTAWVVAQGTEEQ